MPQVSNHHSEINDRLESAQQQIDAERQVARWSYEDAFCRNLGLINKHEQDRLRNSHVAIAGLGGVGGLHLITLARLGIGKFTIADPDTFELANTNRQYGARTDSIGRSKVEVMAEAVRRINPEIELHVFPERIGAQNVERFLESADIFVDGIDLFAVEARRHLFRQARANGLFAVTAGPVGFSAAWLVFSPDGMTFDRYFDLSDDQDDMQRNLAFLIGSSPSATQLAYMDLAQMDVKNRTAPSTAAGCQLAAGVMATEICKVLLQRGRIWPAPYYQQFDAYLSRLIRRRLWFGNRHPWQRIKRWWLYRQFQAGNAAWATSNVTQKSSHQP